MPIDLSKLNEAQRKAVLTTEGPLFTIAGPGSGKTNVLTHRVAHLVGDLNVDPRDILAITFTNKAAREMKTRIEKLLGGVNINSMWVLTFHGMCLRMLRASGGRIGLGKFVIYDDKDSKTLMTSITDDMDLKEHRDLKSFRSLISNAKNALIGPSDLVGWAGDDTEHDWVTVAEVYTAYQRRLRMNSALDFDDMLYETHNLLSNSPAALDNYQRRFRYIHVDEHQDTNHAQYEIIRLLGVQHRNVMVVADDDQGIYGWRGADIKNIDNFLRDFKNGTSVVLGQNYRSTRNIVEAASSMVAKNRERKEKRLFSEKEVGDPVHLHTAKDEFDEASYIATELTRAMKRLKDAKFSDVALLYRTSVQSRSFESALIRAQIPYVIVKGTAFFERAEVKDAMSALRVATYPDDDVALMRMLTSTHMPKRGIGKETLRKIAAESESQNLSLDAGMRQAVLYGWDCVPTKSLKSIEPFLNIVDEMRRIAAASTELHEVVRRIVERTGLMEALAGLDDEGEDRVANVRELTTLASEFASSRGPEDAEGLGAFLEWLTLQGGEMLQGGSRKAAPDDSRNAVRLMTAHASKGLEYRIVFVVGVEEEYMPHMRATLADPRVAEGLIAEERRLLYVAMTRAKEVLYLTRVEQRMVAGKTLVRRGSRFLSEIPSGNVVKTAWKAPSTSYRPPPPRWPPPGRR